MCSVLLESSLTLALVHRVEVRVVEGLQCADALVGVQSYQVGKQIDLEFVQRGRVLGHLDGAELGEARFEVLQLEGIGPVLLIGSPQHLKNLENLVDLRVTHEQGPALHHFGEDAPCGPQIDAQSVSLLT